MLLNHRCVAIRHDAGRVESVVVRTDGEEREHDGRRGALEHRRFPSWSRRSTRPPPREVRAAARAPALPQPLPGRADDHRGGALPRQLDLPARSAHARRPGAELRRLEPGHGPRGQHLPRGRVLLLRGRRDLEDARLRGASRWRPRTSATIGLLDPVQVFNGVKVRVPKAYPMYDSRYREAVAEIRGYLEHFENLKTFGRNGLHRYNNQDHSMWTAILATLNHTDGASHDVWSVNTKAEYLEEGPLAEGLDRPGPRPSEKPRRPGARPRAEAREGRRPRLRGRCGALRRARRARARTCGSATGAAGSASSSGCWTRSRRSASTWCWSRWCSTRGSGASRPQPRLRGRPLPAHDHRRRQRASGGQLRGLDHRQHVRSRGS